MCYSAMVEEDYRSFVRATGAQIDLLEFMRMFGLRASGKPVAIPKAMEAPFAWPTNDPEERQIHTWIVEHNERLRLKLFEDIAAQEQRLAKATAAIEVRETKKAKDDVRIATKKIADYKGKLEDVDRADMRPRDSRIFPGSYALVMVSEGGRRVVKPMRYQCRVAGKPAWYDQKFPGTYNARRDNLEGYWKGVFGRTHGVVILSRFYEHVQRAGDDGQARDVVLEFTPRDGGTIYAACLWSHWTDGEEELLSFALVTDDPPPEVLAAGHDRCIIPIRPENVDSWLNPDASNLGEQYRVLADREPHFYEHRLAA